MKRRAIIAVVLAAVFGAMSAAHGLELEEGFLDTPWTTPPSGVKGLSKVGGDGKVAYYVKPDRAYRIFDSEVPEVVYGFYDDKLFAVYVNLEEIDVFSQIKRYIGQKYGLPKTSRETRGELTTYAWSVKDTRIKLKHGENYSRMKLGFYYMPVARRLNAELQKDFEDEPPGPIFPLSERRQKDAIEHFELLNF